MTFSGKAAWITGGANGIGRASAVGFARLGADVLILDVLAAEEAAGVVRDVEALGRRAVYVRGDVSQREDCERALEAGLAAFGRMDVLLNNAAYSRLCSFLEMDVALLERTLAVILGGTFHATQLAARQMIAQGTGGAVVNISSVHATRAYPRASAYNAAKAGLNHMAATWAVELAPHGIRINSIEPGWIDTPGERAKFNAEDFAEGARKILMRRLGSPEEIAEVVLFLASEAASYITGTVVRADGGFVLPGPAV